MAKRLTPHERYLRTITEEAWKQTVIAAARGYGWGVFFIPDRFHARARAQGYLYQTKMPDAGYPDLTLIGPRSIIWVELKREDGSLQDNQEVWKSRIEQAGGEYYLWKPSDTDLMMQRLEAG